MAQLHITRPPALLALESLGSSCFASSHPLAPFQPDLGSPMLAQTSQVGSVRRNRICEILGFCSTPGPPAVRRGSVKLKIQRNIINTLTKEVKHWICIWPVTLRAELQRTKLARPDDLISDFTS